MSGQGEPQNCSFTENQLCFILEELNVINDCSFREWK